MFTALITQSNCWQREMKAQSTGSARRSTEQLGFLFYFNGGLESSTALGHHHSTTAEFVCYIIYHFSWSILFIEDLLKYLLFQAKNMSLNIYLMKSLFTEHFEKGCKNFDSHVTCKTSYFSNCLNSYQPQNLCSCNELF